MGSSCHDANGRKKSRYPSRKSAMQGRTKVFIKAYKCPECGFFHVAKKPRYKKQLESKA